MGKTDPVEVLATTSLPDKHGLEGPLTRKDTRYRMAQIRYRSFLATALASIGALKRAARVLDSATERAERLGGFGEQVALQWERARLLWMEATAMRRSRYSGTLAQIADDTLQIARAHLFSAQILNLEGRAEEAGPHLERAERLLEFGDDTVDRGALRAEQAKREAKLGRGERALTLAHEAAELLAGHVRHASNAWHAMGAAHAALGDIDAADADYDRAVSALVERGQWREAIHVARDWADLLRKAGRDERAYAVLKQATSFGQRVAHRAVAPAALDRRHQLLELGVLQLRLALPLPSLLGEAWNPVTAASPFGSSTTIRARGCRVAGSSCEY